MRPRRLAIKGLNSFIDEQVIDFEKLTSKGLFGIFGPTGSGKSTILDAITLALYGDIARDSKEYINSFCDGVSISYEFEIGVGKERKIYVADRVVNKDKKGRYKLKLCRLIEIINGEEIPIAEGAMDVKNNVEQVIGLKAEDFTRSVVLPQGKFNEFLKLTGSQRRDMLERIFGLEKYGRSLGEKIKKVRREKQSELSILNTKVQSLTDRGVSEEAFKALKFELEKLKEEEEKLSSEKLKIDKEYERLKNIWQLQKELEGYREIRADLLLKREEVDNKIYKIDRAKRALILKPLSDNCKNINKDIRINEEKLKELTLSFSVMDKNIELLNSKYSEALKKKDEDLPKIFEKEARLERALKLQKDLIDTKNQRQKLAESYRGLNGEYQKVKDKLKSIEEEKNINTETLVKLEKNLEECNISPQYREKVMEGASIQRDLKLKRKELQEINDKKKEKQSYCNSLDLKLQSFNKSHEEKEKLITELEVYIENLKDNCPGNNESLIEVEKKKAILAISFKEIERYKNKKKEIEYKIKTIKDEVINSEKEKSVLNLQVEDFKKELNTLLLDIEHINKMNMAEILSKELKEGSPCPVCGSIHHTKTTAEFDDAILKEKANSKEALEIKIKKLEEKLKALDFTLSQKKMLLEMGVKEEEDNERSLHNINLLDIDVNLINIEEIESFSNKYLDNLDKLKSSIEHWNKEKESKEEGLRLLKEERFKIEKDKERTIEILKLENNALDDMNFKEIEARKSIDLLNNSLSKIKQETLLEDFDKAFEDIKLKDEELLDIKKSHKQLQENIRNLELKKEVLIKELNELDIKKAKIEEAGKEKKAFIDKWEIEFNELSEGKDPLEYIDEIKKLKEDIINKEATLRKDLDKIKVLRQKLSEDIIGLKQTIESFKGILYKQKEELKTSLEENKFLSEEEISEFLMDSKDIEVMEVYVKNYEARINDVFSNINSIEKKLKGESIKEEQWINIVSKKENLQAILQNIIRDIAAKEQIVGSMEKDLKDFNQLLKEVKAMSRVCSNLDEIMKLIEGNKFVEFVAQNQLRYISMEASKRLKDITRGRYALEIDESGNFIMRDDFSGGIRRATNTLSGGETFLTSLALALSLSSQIQLKGSAPLEFFFLDEGFGTLDSELLDTVITSLENLHSNKLAIGLISHVEELKNRVPIKLLVDKSPKDGMGSYINMELT